MPVVAFALVVFYFFVITVMEIFVNTFLRRRKVARYLHAELSDTFLDALNRMSRKPTDFATIAWYFDYMADLIERNWRQLFIGEAMSNAAQLRIHEIARSIAAGMRQTALEASFRTKTVRAGQSFETAFTQTLTSQFIAISTLRYGDLLLAEPKDIPI